MGKKEKEGLVPKQGKIAGSLQQHYDFTEDFPQVKWTADKEEALRKAESRIQRHVSNFACDHKGMLGQARIGECVENAVFDNYSLKRVSSDRCMFDNCSFRNVAGTGSTWTNTVFSNCLFQDSNFMFGDFSGSTFRSRSVHDSTTPDFRKSTAITGCGFLGTHFEGATLDDIVVQGSSFVQCNFSNANILDSTLETTTFEGSVFRFARLRNIALRDVNVDYSDFTGAVFDRTRFPLMQVCYVFGALEAVLEDKGLSIDTKDEARFPGGVLPREEFETLLPELLTYYECKAEFFPIANVYLTLQDMDAFRAAIEMGIRLAVAVRDIRTAKFLCKLARLSESYSRSDLATLHDLLKFLVREADDDRIQFDYILHAGELRSLLLPLSEYPSAALQFTLVPKNGASGICVGKIIERCSDRARGRRDERTGRV